MMLEWLMVPALMGVAALVPMNGQSDKKKINTIFNTIGYGVPSKDRKTLMTPKFKKKVPILDGQEEIGTRYFYTIPLGLPATRLADDEKRMNYFNDGLGRPVIVQYKAESENNPKKYLQISVYDREITRKYPYALVPSVKGWVIPLGKTLEGTIWHDFEKIPHITVAGTTRFGKTVFLKVLVTYLITHHRQDVEFSIIDLKGGLEFGRYETLRQVKGVASNPVEAFEMLQNIHEQLQEDYILFRKNHWTNVKHTPLKRRKFIIVDEAAQLAPEKWMEKKEKDLLGACQWLLGEITRIGGGLGYHLVFATQYPTSDTLPRQIKQNSDGRITFRLPSGYASDVAIDETGAEKLPSDVQGRALYKTHELKEMQVPLIEDDEMWKLLKGEIKDGINECGEETETAGGHSVEFSSNEVCDKRTPSKNAQPRSRPKRNQRPKGSKGVSTHSESPGEKRVLPKRKGKGTNRGNNSGEMDSPSGTSLT